VQHSEDLAKGSCCMQSDSSRMLGETCLNMSALHRSTGRKWNIPSPVCIPKIWLTTALFGAIQQIHVKYDKAVKIRPGNQYHTNAMRRATKKNRRRDIFQPLATAFDFECRVESKAQLPKIPGQMIEAGSTTQRDPRPATPNPRSWVHMTISMASPAERSKS
jgi:hypothetical protein